MSTKKPDAEDNRFFLDKDEHCTLHYCDLRQWKNHMKAYFRKNSTFNRTHPIFHKLDEMSL